MNNIHFLLFFWGQYGDLATREEQYSLSRRWGEYCISSVARSSYWLEKKTAKFILLQDSAKYTNIKFSVFKQRFYFEAIAKQIDERSVSLDDPFWVQWSESKCYINLFGQL